MTKPFNYYFKYMYFCFITIKLLANYNINHNKQNSIITCFLLQFLVEYNFLELTDIEVKMTLLSTY